MTPQQLFSHVTQWLKMIVVVAILVSIAVVLLRSLGVVIPLRTLGHVEIAYLAGAYWLVK